MNRTQLNVLVVGSTVLVAGLDFYTSADLVASILFTFPLALCAARGSQRLLWSTATASILLTIAAAFVGINRVDFHSPWVISANRVCLILSLLTLTVFIHQWIEKSRRVLLDAVKIARQSDGLVSQHEQIEDLAGAATRNVSDRKEAAAQLALVKARYRGLLEAAPDAMVVVNHHGNIVLANVQAEKQFGYGRDQLVGRQVEGIIPQGFAERLIADGSRTAAQAQAQHIGTGIELSARRRDGSEFPIELMLSPLQSPEGILVTAAIRDISARKVAEERLADTESRRGVATDALRESEERYRLLVDGVEDHAIFAMDPGGQVVSWNAGAQRMKGYSADEAIGHNFSRFFPLDEIERGRPAEVLRLTAVHGRHEEQSMRVRKDGSRFLANLTFTALRDTKGNLRGFSEFSHDLSESKEAGAKYRGLLEAAPDAMVVVNQAGAIVLLNLQAEKQFGYHRDELVGQPVKNIIPKGFAERLIADGTRTAAEALEQQIGTGIELVAQRKDGSEFPIELMLSPLQSTEGILVTAAIRDISARKRAEVRLADTESERGFATDALRESEERYRLLVDGVEDHAIFAMDPAGQIVSWNAGAQRMKGYSADEAIGRNFSRFFPPDEVERGRPAEVLRLTAVHGRHEEQGMRVRKDGSRFLASLTFTALRDAKGTLRGFSEFSHDLSESKESGAKYLGLLEAAPDAMVVVDQAGAIVLLNLQAEKQFGYHRDELVGQPVKNIIPKGFAERLIADGTRTAAEALEQQIGTGIELVARRKDGSEFPIEIMLSPLQNAEGILVTAAIRDITARKVAEGHLAQVEGRYRGLLEAAPDAMVVVNEAGAIVLLNLQAEKQLRYRRHELVGQPVKNIIPEGFAERLIADGTRTAAEALAQHIGMGIELSARRKDGSAFPIELMLSPLQSADGILVTAAIRDITVRKAAEQHLAQMESRQRGLLEAAPDSMVLVNQEDEIVLVNAQAERQFGYRRDELVGQQLRSIIPEIWTITAGVKQRAGDTLRPAGEPVAPGVGAGVELDGRRKDGSELPLEITLSTLHNQEGVLVTVAIRDITTRKKAEARLLQTLAELNASNEELGQFAYIASHDLQEPLRMVASYTQLLAKRYKGKLDPDADEFIAFAVDGANRMQRLIQDLLAYSRVGTKKSEFPDTSSEEALERAMANLGIAIESSGALVTHDPLPHVRADEGQLVQLFQNLVGNAIKYQSPGIPRVHVSFAKNGGAKWVFSVKDNGLGIEAQYFEKIFGMFQRLHGREEFDGTGIGLAICKKIVERHGGSISVESQPGQGSTFRFALACGNESP